MGNPLLNPKAFNVQRRWDDDVVFKNQARGTEQKGKKEFVNVRLIPLLKMQVLFSVLQYFRISFDQISTNDLW